MSAFGGKADIVRRPDHTFGNFATNLRVSVALMDEFEDGRLMKAAKANRNGQRDSTMILIAFRHGLRAAELVDLRWDQVDLGRNACLHAA
jgi:integrase